MNPCELQLHCPPHAQASPVPGNPSGQGNCCEGDLDVSALSGATPPPGCFSLLPSGGHPAPLCSCTPTAWGQEASFGLFPCPAALLGQLEVGALGDPSFCLPGWAGRGVSPPRELPHLPSCGQLVLTLTLSTDRVLPGSPGVRMGRGAEWNISGLGRSSGSVWAHSLRLRLPSPTHGLLAQILGAAANSGAGIGSLRFGDRDRAQREARAGRRALLGVGAVQGGGEERVFLLRPGWWELGVTLLHEAGVARRTWPSTLACLHTPLPQPLP